MKPFMNDFVKILLFSFSGILLFISCKSDRNSATFEPEKYTAEQFFKNVRIAGGSFSPDGSKLLVSTNESGIFNAIEIPIDGSPIKELTNSTEESIFAMSYTPDGNGFIYTADKGGNEINHIYLVTNGNEVKDLTPGENEKAGFSGWSRDKKSFYYTSNGRDPRFFDLMKMDLEKHSSTILYENLEGVQPASLSVDEKYLAAIKPVTTSSNEMFLINRETGETVDWKWDENQTIWLGPANGGK